ncbi:MAG: response regulator [Acidobacteriaceae bacterium]
MTRLLLIDDHILFRDSLSRLLSAERDLEVVGACSSLEESLSVLLRESVDVVLLDFDLGEWQGLDFIQAARSKGFSGKVLMVTAGMNGTDTLLALKRGASGIVLKHNPPAELIQAIHRILEGGTWLDPSIVQSLAVAATRVEANSQSGHILNARERDVLKGVFEGLSNKEIATRLRISEGYVKAVLQQLFGKTGVRTRSQLVRIVLENPTEYGMMPEPGPR